MVEGKNVRDALIEVIRDHRFHTNDAILDALLAWRGEGGSRLAIVRDATTADLVKSMKAPKLLVEVTQETADGV